MIRLFCASMVLSFFAIQTTFAEIRQTSHFREIVDELSSGDILALDLDNTTMEPKTSFGSDQYYFYLIERNLALGMKKVDAESDALKSWNQLQFDLQMKPVDPEAPELIKKLQGQGVKVMGLTARVAEIADCTFNQLKSIGVDFTQNPVWDSEVRFSEEDINFHQEVLFKHGILFIGENLQKGSTFKIFLDKIKMSPKKIVFVDDRDKHVANMEETFGNREGLSIVNFRFGATDKKKDEFKIWVDQALRALTPLAGN